MENSKTSIAIDTNILIRLEKGKETMKSFIELVNGNDMSLYFSEDVLSEIMMGGDAEKNRDKYNAIGCLYERLGKNFFLRRGFRETVRAELKNNGSIETPLVLGSDDLANLVARLRDPSHMSLVHSDQQESLGGYNSKKDELVASDKLFRKKIQNQDIAFANSELKNYCSFSRKIFDFQTTFMQGTGRGMSEKTLKMIEGSRKNRYCYIKTIQHLLRVRILLYIVGGQCKVEELKSAAAIERGNWIDLFIAASASGLDYFVTNDKRLQSICEFLRSKNAVGFKTVELDMFFKLFAIAKHRK